jgi:hypothetical protein
VFRSSSFLGLVSVFFQVQSFSPEQGKALNIPFPKFYFSSTSPHDLGKRSCRAFQNTHERTELFKGMHNKKLSSAALLKLRKIVHYLISKQNPLHLARHSLNMKNNESKRPS